ncbi:MAG: SDR family oxidoreductase [Gammaproteobacteria bacterium]
MSMTRRNILIGTCLLALGACTSGRADLGSSPRTVLVAGATGRTGTPVVTQLLAEGYKVRALVRDPEKARETLGDQVTYLTGDVTDPATLAPAMQGVDAVISAIGAKGKDGPSRPEVIDYEGVKNLAAAASAAGVKQFVLVSSRSVTQKDHPLNRMFGDVLIWKLKGENALRASGVPYTIIRPGGLVNAEPGQASFVFEQGDEVRGQTRIARADLATICVQALKYPEALNRTFETHTVPGSPITDWRARFRELKPDPSM